MNEPKIDRFPPRPRRRCRVGPRASAILALATLVALLVPSPALRAQVDAPFPFELPEIFSDDNIRVEINLPRFLIGMVAGATEESDQEFSRLIDGLQDIRVRIAEKEDGLPQSAVDQLRTASRQLDRQGWYPLMKVREDEEEFYLYLKQDDDTMSGVLVLFASATEAGLIHIRGTVNPEDLGRLGQRLDLPALSDALESHPMKKSPEAP